MNLVGGKVESLPFPFLKFEKSVVLRVSKVKSPIFFSRAFLSCVVDDMFIKM